MTARIQTLAFGALTGMLILGIWWIVWTVTNDRFCSSIVAAIVVVTCAPLLSGSKRRRRSAAS